MLAKRLLLSLATVAVIGGLVATVAVATDGTADWGQFRSDLIRCQDAATGGHPACGTVTTGTDPLSSGRVTVNDDADMVHVRLRGAVPNKTYFLSFIALHNTSSNTLGPYSGQIIQLGQFSTNNRGRADATFSDTALDGPMIGYFDVHTNSHDHFVTGIDTQVE
jgi:hypothetical protein